MARLALRYKVDFELAFRLSSFMHSFKGIPVGAILLDLTFVHLDILVYNISTVKDQHGG